MSYDWSEPLEDALRQRMAERGVAVEDIRWRGFSSQGDGASFTGSVEDSDMFLDKEFNAKEFPFIRKAMALGGYLSVRLARRGGSMYSHENTVSLDVDLATFRSLLAPKSEFATEVATQWDTVLYEELNEFEERALAALRYHMRQFYRELETEYDLHHNEEV